MTKSTFRKIQDHVKAHTLADVGLVLGILAFFAIGSVLFWISSFRLPDLSSFEQRKVVESTKIYDKTGTILLYDLHDDVKRTILPAEDISPLIKKAAVAIEDDTFYEHWGVRPISFLRAVIANVLSGGFSQGGSTITQQVVKNTLLTNDKSPSRKIKEWVLAVKLEKVLTKDAIISSYLNEIPYGGSLYGVEEASRQFYGKSAKDVTLAEAAYLAAIPQATTYYSPYGKNLAALETRKNLVLSRMLDLGFITQAEYDGAKAERVAFQPKSPNGSIRAPHFVFFVKDWLEKELGTGALEELGYKIVTTLDYDLQEKAENLVKETALSNKENFEAENAALVALDPKTGGVLAMVGSRDYFDEEIDGEFNVAISHNRQPGSTMKPIVYAQAFVKGYTPETVVFDLPTSFSVTCDLEGKPIEPDSTEKCFMPGNYDEQFRGPMTLRNALAQSINVPAVKVFYLAGVRDSLALAKDMGITSLTNPDQYGLSLVLGSGEISLLEMVGAYGVFANDGTRTPTRPVLQVLDSDGEEVRLPSQRQSRVLPANVARYISSILSDNAARTPAYGPNSVLNFPTRDVAVKTGTTNDSRDAWTIGYSPNIVVGVWAGNNDNRPMVKKVAGQIVAPMWSSFMRQALATVPDERFIPPTSPDPATLKPVMKGIWEGGDTYTIDTVSGKLATAATPPETRKEIAVRSIHSILYWLDKDDPFGPRPSRPEDDPQFERWESPVRAWASEHGLADQTSSVVPTAYDDVHSENSSFKIFVQNLNAADSYDPSETISIFVQSSGKYGLSKASLYVNDTFVESIDRQPFMFRFSPKDVPGLREENSVRIVGNDTVFNRSEATATFRVRLDG